MTTTIARWSAEAEMRRVNDLAAGVRPSLFSHWASSPTAELVEALADYETLPDTDDGTWNAALADLRAEIAYRSGL